MIVLDPLAIPLPDQLRNLADMLRIAADEIEAEHSDIRKRQALLALEEARARYLKVHIK